MAYDADYAKQYRQNRNHQIQEKIYWVAYIVVTVGALVAAGAAAYYAKGAYYQAKRQANAAESANSPFLFVESISITANRESGFILFPNWTNSGSSPAIDVLSKTACGQVDIAIDSISPSFYRKATTTKLLLGPKQTRPGGACIQKYAVTADRAKEINSGKSFYVIAGKACYRYLGSSKWHLTEFFYKVVSVDMKTGEFAFTNIGEQNCEDEQCADYSEMCP